MKRAITLAVFLLCVACMVGAQSRTGSKTSGTPFTDRLWVGLHIGNISFGTNQYGNGTFNINLAPIVGVDLVQGDDPRQFFTSLSAGFMLKFDYFYSRLNISPQLDKYSRVDLGPTLFTRMLMFNKVFLQLEFEKATFKRPNDIDPLKNDKISEDYLYVGLGYSSGEEWRYEISIYYNLLDDFGYVRIPFDYRIAVIYHF